ILHQATTNEAQYVGSCGFGFVPFFKEVTKSISSIGNLWQSWKTLLSSAFQIQRSHFTHGFLVIQSIDLIYSYSTHMPEIGNTVGIFRVVEIVLRDLIWCLYIPIHAWALNADRKLLKGDNFVAP